MALTVEDGTGIAGADAYVSLVDALTYSTDYGLGDWSAVGVDDAAREKAIRRATEYIDVVYAFISERKTTTQGLEFPRLDSNIDAMPVRLQFACARLAVFALNNDLAPFQTTTGVKAQRLKLGDLEKETTYETPSINMPVFQYVDAMLRDLYIYKRLGSSSAGVFR